MHDRRRCDGLDRIEPGAELSLDLGERAPGSDDQNIDTGVVIGVGGQPILSRVRAETDHRDPTTESVIDLAGFVPFQGRNDQPGSVEEASLLEFGSQGSPIHDIEARSRPSGNSALEPDSQLNRTSVEIKATPTMTNAAEAPNQIRISRLVCRYRAMASPSNGTSIR